MPLEAQLTIIASETSAGDVAVALKRVRGSILQRTFYVRGAYVALSSWWIGCLVGLIAADSDDANAYRRVAIVTNAGLFCTAVALGLFVRSTSKVLMQLLDVVESKSTLTSQRVRVDPVDIEQTLSSLHGELSSDAEVFVTVPRAQLQKDPVPQVRVTEEDREGELKRVRAAAIRNQAPPPPPTHLLTLNTHAYTTTLPHS